MSRPNNYVRYTYVISRYLKKEYPKIIFYYPHTTIDIESRGKNIKSTIKLDVEILNFK